MLRAGNLILIWLALLGVIVVIRKLSWLNEALIITLVWWWMRLDARPTLPFATSDVRKLVNLARRE